MLTPDHPGLNRVPQALRNPGAALNDHLAGAALPGRMQLSLRKLGWGSWAQMLGLWRGAPSHPHAWVLSQPCLLFPAGPGHPPQTPHGLEATPSTPAPPAQQASSSASPGVQRNGRCFSCPQPESYAPSRTFPLSCSTPPTWSSPALCAGTPGGWGTTGMCDA